MRVEQAVPPGRKLADVMERLDALDDDGLAEALERCERDLRASQAERAATVAAAQARMEAKGHPLSGAMETVAAITVTSTRAAAHLMDASVTVCERPAVWAALAQGTIDMGRAQVIAGGLAEVEGPDRDRLEAKALEFAASHTTFQTRRYLARLLVDHDPGLAEREKQKQRAKAWDRRHIGGLSSFLCKSGSIV